MRRRWLSGSEYRLAPRTGGYPRLARKRCACKSQGACLQRLSFYSHVVDRHIVGHRAETSTTARGWREPPAHLSHLNICAPDSIGIFGRIRAITSAMLFFSSLTWASETICESANRTDQRRTAPASARERDDSTSLCSATPSVLYELPFRYMPRARNGSML